MQGLTFSGGSITLSTVIARRLPPSFTWNTPFLALSGLVIPEAFLKQEHRFPVATFLTARIRNAVIGVIMLTEKRSQRYGLRFPAPGAVRNLHPRRAFDAKA